LVLATFAAAHGAHDHEHDERTCGTPALTQDEVAREDVITSKFTESVCEKMPHLNFCPGVYEANATKINSVCLWMHVIFDPVTNEGNMNERQVADQFEVFNSDFGGRNRQGHGRGGFETNFQFRLEGVTRTGNGPWFRNIQANEVAATTALARDPCRCQQVYFSALPNSLLGYCYLPSSFNSCSPRHGCFNDYRTAPGGSRTNYNLGQTVTHEVGHAFGLLHVFQGSQCTGCGGDQVCDTNPQRNPTNGCPVNAANSCNLADGRRDNINNFLDYSIDRCMCEFTRLQSARMDAQIAQFRPGFLGADFKAQVESLVPGAYAEAEQYQMWNMEHPKQYGSAVVEAQSAQEQFEALRN